MTDPQEILGRANQLATSGKLEEAENLFKSLLDSLKDTDPNLVATLHGYGTLQLRSGKLEAAKTLFQEADRILPKNASILTNLGVVFKQLGELEEAIHCYTSAIEQNPNHLSAHTNLGILLVEKGDRDAAKQYFDHVIGVAPDDVTARFNRSLLHLIERNFIEGWQDYRYRTRMFGMAPLNAPEWRGEALKDKGITIFAEQGLGDSIQGVRYIKQLKILGAKHITVVCHEPLIELFSCISEIDEIYPLKTQVSAQDFAVHMMSLPAILNESFDDPASHKPYLTVPAELEKKWEPKERSNQLTVGINWQGNPDFKNDTTRSIPLNDFRPLAELESVALTSLQVGDAGLRQLANFKFRKQIQELPEQRSLTETAAVMKNLDLIVTSCTSIAHLGGALGVQTWVLLDTQSDWRWFSGESSPWYPSVRLFRQQSPGDWPAVMQQVVTAIQEL